MADDQRVGGFDQERDQGSGGGNLGGSRAATPPSPGRRAGDTPMRLAVVGSTKFYSDARAGALAGNLIAASLEEWEPEVVISGGAKGIDSLAANLARTLGIKVIEHLPKNPRWEPEGYKERNQRIAEDCTHLLCIRHAASSTSGSGWTADQAERLGKVVERHVI